MKPEIMKQINEGEYHWTVNDLKHVLASANGWWGTKGFETSWEKLVGNLNKGMISVQIEECPIYPIPDREVDFEEWVQFDRYATRRGNYQLVHMRWCGYKWILEKTGEEPRHLTSGANGYAESLKMAIQAGESCADGVMDWLRQGDKIAIIPYPADSKLFVYIFSAKEEFVREEEEAIAALMNRLHESMKKNEQEYFEKRNSDK
ncbi:hypothetical protein [Bacillus thuringiensis]|uniref:hypothetical protein n=1 Tax=Bacillus thuringiensis TaxID=1428 RepID=UPI0021D69DAE|nr:hypothetical protein [Bacillus thuringiensis]MCU7667307.1 hypothetical protein [Bacillus thuringiensis]